MSTIRAPVNNKTGLSNSEKMALDGTLRDDPCSHCMEPVRRVYYPWKKGKERFQYICTNCGRCNGYY